MVGVRAGFRRLVSTWVRSHRRAGGGRRTITFEQQTRLEAVPDWTYAASKDAFWERAATAFETFAGREGRCHTPRHHREDGINIDAWSKQQRARFLRGDLSAERALRLEAIPGWSWSPQLDAWEQGFAVPGTRGGNRNSCGPPRPGARRLPAWRLGGGAAQPPHPGQIAPERRERLEALNGWTWDPHGDSWERHYEALRAFVAREGHARVPTDHVEDDLPLASWVIRHRQEHKTGKVPADRVARLEAQPGWVWDVLAARWDDNFAALRGFADREGHARVPTDHAEGDIRLGQWVIAQRQSNRKGELARERAARLAAVQGWVWDTRDAAWDEGFASLVRFQQRTGHSRVPRTWMEDGYRLGQWMGVQQGLLRSGHLRGDRAVRLTALLDRDSDQQGTLTFP